MVSDKVNFDLGAGFEEGGSYKSNFARSMAVNSQYRVDRSVDLRQQLRVQTTDNGACDKNNKGGDTQAKPPEPPEVVRLRKDFRLPSDDSHRLSYGSNSSSRRTSLCLNRLSDQPVEQFILQSQIDTLQWQLKETESSREMYRAVMRQVVIFLERAHRSLELLGTRIGAQRVSRPQSEYYTSTSTISENGIDNTLTETANLSASDISSYKEIAWRRLKKPEPSSEEIPPEKLSQEAFRLLRTAQSLLSTHEPDLAHVSSSNSEEDLNFLAQLAKEFPPAEPKPQRTTSFSLCPKLLTPEKDVKISTAFNRKLSLQLNDNVRRSSFLKDVSTKLNVTNDSPRSSVAETDCILSSTLIDDGGGGGGRKFKYEKSSSPPVSSIGSTEDESGFSSMNSFQEVGLPTGAHHPADDPKEAFLKGVLHNGGGAFAHNCHSEFFRKDTAHDEIKLWQTPNVIHKRWSSTPVDNISQPEKTTMKVLWV